jgi:hypothetical protein
MMIVIVPWMRFESKTILFDIVFFFATDYVGIRLLREEPRQWALLKNRQSATGNAS